MDKLVQTASQLEADARTRTGDPFITRDRKRRNAGAREGARGHESPAPDRKRSALGETADDTAAQPDVRGEYAGEPDGPRDGPRRLELVRHDAADVERLAEWYVARSAGDPRYGDAADALVALAIVLGALADRLEAKDEPA